MALILTRYDFQFLMQPVIFLHANNYIQDFNYNITKDWVVHKNPFGYTNRDGCMNKMMHFKTVCGENKLNSQVLFYDEND